VDEIARFHTWDPAPSADPALVGQARYW